MRLGLSINEGMPGLAGPVARTRGAFENQALGGRSVLTPVDQSAMPVTPMVNLDVAAEELMDLLTLQGDMNMFGLVLRGNFSIGNALTAQSEIEPDMAQQLRSQVKGVADQISDTLGKINFYSLEPRDANAVATTVLSRFIPDLPSILGTIGISHVTPRAAQTVAFYAADTNILADMAKAANIISASDDTEFIEASKNVFEGKLLEYGLVLNWKGTSAVLDVDPEGSFGSVMSAIRNMREILKGQQINMGVSRTWLLENVPEITQYFNVPQPIPGDISFVMATRHGEEAYAYYPDKGISKSVTFVKNI